MPLKEQSVPTQEAPKSKTQSIVDDIYADLAAEKARKDKEYAEALARRAMEETPSSGNEKNPWAVYVNIDEAVRQAYDQMEEEEPTREENQDPDYLVRTEITNRGEVVTIPNIERRLQDGWEEALFSYEEPDEIIEVSKGVSAVARSGSHLRLGVRRMPHGLSIAMVDTYEGELTQLRLHGRLLPGTDPELGERMGYVPDETKFIHPSVVRQTEQSLRNMLKVVYRGAIIDSR